MRLDVNVATSATTEWLADREVKEPERAVTVVKYPCVEVSDPVASIDENVPLPYTVIPSVPILTLLDTPRASFR